MAENDSPAVEPEEVGEAQLTQDQVDKGPTGPSEGDELEVLEGLYGPMDDHGVFGKDWADGDE